MEDPKLEITPEFAEKLGKAMSEEIQKRLFLWHSLPVQTRVLIEMGLIKNPLDDLDMEQFKKHGEE
jgi:hypothetical protein